MFAVESIVHCLLKFESGVLGVGCSCLSLHNDALLFGLAVELLVAYAVAVLPIAATVVHSLERNLVLRIELIVECQRVALTLACYIILTHLSLFQFKLFVVVLLIFKLCIVRTARCILVRGCCHNTKLMVEESVAPCCTEVKLRFAAHPCIARTYVEVQYTMRRSILGHKVYLTTDGIAVHIGCNNLVYLYGLNHIGRNKVELHVTCVAFGRRDAVAIDCY